MMKAFRIAAVAVVALLLAVCILAPSASAASVETSGTQYFNSTRYTAEVDLQASSYLISGSTCWVYTQEEYQKLMTTGSATGVMVNQNGTLCTQSGKYGIVSLGSSFQAMSGTSYVSVTLGKMDAFNYTFTGMKDSTVGIHIDINKLTGPSSTVRVLVVKSSVVATVKNIGVKDLWNSKDYDSFVLCKSEYDAGTSSIDLSVKCVNTDNYCVFVSMDDGVSASYHMKVSGVAEFTSSNVLSIVMIIIALALLGVLLYISNKKLIK